MNWTDPYTEDVRALERLRYDIIPIDFSWPESVQKDFDSLAPVLDELMALLKDHANNSTVLEKATELWWNRWGLGEIANSRKEAAIEIKLQPLYQRLMEASDEEVRETRDSGYSLDSLHPFSITWRKKARSGSLRLKDHVESGNVQQLALKFAGAK